MKAQYSFFKDTLMIAIIALIILSTTIPSSAQDWYDLDWQYRREITVNNPGGTELTDFQILITLDATFDFLKANSDGSDIRVTDADQLTLIPFWIEFWDDTGDTAFLWVKIPTVPAIGKNIYLYYGNSLATSESDGFTTFDFFDDFNTTHLQGNWIRSLTWTGSDWGGYTSHDWKYSMIMQENSLNYAMIRADSSWTIESLDDGIEQEFNYIHGLINANGTVSGGSPGQYEYGVILSALGLGYLHFETTNPTLAQQCYDDMVKVYGYVRDTWGTAGTANNYSMTLRGFANACKAFTQYGNTSSASESQTIIENYVTAFIANQSSGFWSSPGGAVQTQLKRNFAVMLSYDITGNSSYLDAVKDNIDWIIANRWIPATGGVTWTSSGGTVFYECHQIWFMIAVKMLYIRSGGSYDYLSNGLDAWYFLTDNNYSSIDMYVHNYDNHDAFFSYRNFYSNGTYQQSSFKGSYEIGVALWGMALNYSWLSNYQSSHSSQAYNYLDEMVKQIKKSPVDNGFLTESAAQVDPTKWTSVGSPTAAIVDDGGNSVLSMLGTSSHDALITSNDQSFDDFILETKVRMTVDNNSLCNPEIDFRYTDLTNRYLTLMRGVSINDLFLRRYESGGSYISTGYSFDYTTDYYIYKVIANGEQIILYLDDDQVTDYTDSGTGILSGGISLHNFRSNNPAYFDHVLVRQYASTEPTTIVGEEQSQAITLNIGLDNTTCGDFEVLLKPNRDVTDSYIDSIQFTVKWPESSTVSLENISSAFGITHQGTTNNSGFNYAHFKGIDLYVSSWLSGEEYIILTFSHDQSGSGYADFEIADDTYVQTNNLNYYAELSETDATGSIYQNATNVYLGSCGEIQVMLQGPYGGGGMMAKGLSGNIPLTQPYNTAPWNYTGTESVTVMDTSAIDWVLVDLRSDPSTTVEQKAALLLEDGKIAQYNNTDQGVHFDNTIDGSAYYIVVWHRNHMPVMTLVSTTFDGTTVDFTDETICYGTPTAEVELETGIHGMIAGDINANGYLKYSGPGNDRGLILVRINEEAGTTDINDTAVGYFKEDVMLDYQVKYIGSNNDRAVMVSNLAELTGTSYLNAVYQSAVPGASAKSDNINDGPIHILLAETDGELQVKITTDEVITDGIVDNVQFAISWEVASNDIVVSILENAQSTFGLIPQGEAILFEGKMYQIFVSVMPVELPDPLNINDELVLVSFTKDKPVTVAKSIGIADNAYTTNHNGDYYISFWGKDYTGTIHTASLGIADLENSGLSIYPNPVTSGVVHMEMNLEKAQDLTITVMDVLGKIVASEVIQMNAGVSNNQIALQHLTKGIYYMKAESTKLNTIKKIVKL